MFSDANDSNSSTWALRLLTILAVSENGDMEAEREEDEEEEEEAACVISVMGLTSAIDRRTDKPAASLNPPEIGVVVATGASGEDEPAILPLRLTGCNEPRPRRIGTSGVIDTRLCE
jgi:hypothetical protein